jgi:cytochrome c oxidase subunit 1
MPFHYLGMIGNVRRYSAFVDDYLQVPQSISILGMHFSVTPLDVHKFISIAALFTGAFQLIFLYNLIYSRFKGAPAPENPWQGTSLEWSVPSPPPWDNFGGKHPVVYHDPYQYGVEGSAGDYVMQTSPEQIPTIAREGKS